MALLPARANTPENQQTLEDRTPVPAGDYVVHVVKTEFKQTKAKNGHYLSIHMKILDGDYKGRTLFTNLNLDNPNPVAVEIANKELNSICKACNKQGVEDSDELLQIPFVASVKITAGDAQFPPANETTGYKPADGEVQTPVTAPPVAAVVAAAAPATPVKANKLPWE